MSETTGVNAEFLPPPLPQALALWGGCVLGVRGESEGDEGARRGEEAEALEVGSRVTPSLRLTGAEVRARKSCHHHFTRIILWRTVAGLETGTRWGRGNLQSIRYLLQKLRGEVGRGEFPASQLYGGVTWLYGSAPAIKRGIKKKTKL